MTELQKKQTKSNQATVMGIATSLVTALAVVDWDHLDWTLPSTYFKILVLALPAIGGSVSQIK